jgi:hypothetical protein
MSSGFDRALDGLRLHHKRSLLHVGSAPQQMTAEAVRRGISSSSGGQESSAAVPLSGRRQTQHEQQETAEAVSDGNAGDADSNRRTATAKAVAQGTDPRPPRPAVTSPGEGACSDTSAGVAKDDSVSCSFSAKRRRRSFNLRAHHALGQEASSFRQAWMAEHRCPNGWLDGFITETYGPELTATHKRALKNELRSAVRCAEKIVPPERGHAGLRKHVWVSARKQSSRKRKAGAGRRSTCDALSEEVWHWFVHHLEATRARISSDMLMAAAETMRQELKEHWQQQVELGLQDANAPPRLPKIDSAWVVRWRRAYQVSWRTVNLRYKISARKRNHRIKVFWSNILRVRFLHEALCGPGKLRFVGLDQKPLWFNTGFSAKTLGLIGAKKVAVKENTAASRERFTVMTYCPSWAWDPRGVMGAGRGENCGVSLCNAAAQPEAQASEGGSLLPLSGARASGTSGADKGSAPGQDAGPPGGQRLGGT